MPLKDLTDELSGLAPHAYCRYCGLPVVFGQARTASWGIAYDIVSRLWTVTRICFMCSPEGTVESTVRSSVLSDSVKQAGIECKPAALEPLRVAILGAMGVL